MQNEKLFKDDIIVIRPNCFCYFMNETTEWKNIFNLLS